MTTAFFSALFVCIALPVVANDSWWSFEIRTGSALNFDTNLTIEQPPFSEVSIVSIANGEATVPNLAVHGLIGFGVDL